MLPLVATLVTIVLLGVLAARHFSSVRFAVLCPLLFATMPLIWLGLRDAAPQLVLLPFVTAWLMSFDEYFRSEKPQWLALAGAIVAAIIYLHFVGLVMAPVYAVIGMTTLLARREPAGRALLFVAAFGVVALPWVVATLRDPGPLTAAINAHGLYDANRFGPLQGAREITSWIGLTVRSEAYWHAFNPALLFLGPGGLRDSIFRPQVFLLPFAIPLLRGLWAYAKTPLRASEGMVLAAFLAAPLAIAVLAQPPRPGRLLLLAPFAAIIATRGFTRRA